MPYDFFYNVYYRDKIGLRFGLGILTDNEETQIEGQNLPRSTVSNKSNYRAGITYNIPVSRWIAANFFFDGFLTNTITRSSNTFTAQVFPNPVITRTVTSRDDFRGGGVQAGIGVRFMMTRKFGIYTEMPLVYSKVYHVTEDQIMETGASTTKQKSVTVASGFKLVVPVTIYLLLRL